MNTFGQHFTLTTFGESHGDGIGGIIDGCPSQLLIDFNAIRADLDRRSPAGKADTTQRHEPDEIEWLSGILDGRTLGSPIAFLIRNRDTHSQDYTALRDLYRPGHGDYTWQQKYGLRDARGGGRCSARETVARVVAGAIAKQYLAQQQIAITATATASSVPDNDTIGGVVDCTINGLPAGVGSPLFGKLQALLAAAVMSIPSATGFEVGDGFAAAQMTGSSYRDVWNPNFTTQTNHCGGIMGGLSNGMPVKFRVAFHPVISVPQPVPCMDATGETHLVNLAYSRHDRSQVERAAVIVESMAALVLADLIIV